LAAANLSAAMPYAERLQLTDWQAALAQAMMSHPPHYEQGFFIFNDRPGLGSDIRSDFVETYGRSIANQ
jgi:L-alanine-DL-glutamate epimerase-like enolase superfamily enzyme